MLRKTVLMLLVLIHCHKLVIAQDSPIRDYYNYAFLANTSITNNKMDSAIFYFEKAFAIIKHPFMIDVNNALYALSKSQVKNEEKLAIKYLKLLEGKYVPINDSFFTNHSSLIKYQKLFSKSADSKLKTPIFAKAIEGAIYWDQYYRQKSKDSFGDAYATPFLHSIDSIRIVNDRLTDSFFNYCLANNISCEEAAGDYNQMCIFIFYLHGSTIRYRNHNLLDNTLQSLCKKGLIDSRLVAQWSDQAYYRIPEMGKLYAYGLYGAMSFGIKDKPEIYIKINIPSDSAAAINKRRQNIYLHNYVEEYTLKAKLLCNKELKYGFFISFENYLFVQKEPLNATDFVIIKCE